MKARLNRTFLERSSYPGGSNAEAPLERARGVGNHSKWQAHRRGGRCPKRKQKWINARRTEKPYSVFLFVRDPCARSLAMLALCPDTPKPRLRSAIQMTREIPTRPLRIAAIVGITLVVTVAAGSFWYWQWRTHNWLPSGIALANGRVEAEQIDVATPIAGRVIEVLAEEGGNVVEGQILARIDVAQWQASLTGARADVRRATQMVNQAEAQIVLRDSQCELARTTYDRTQQLFDRGHTPQEQLDIRRTEMEVAEAACVAARADLEVTRELVNGARAEVERLEILIADSELRAPRAGRVLYRLAEPGEVVGAGTGIITLIDPTDVYMTIFLPTSAAGRLAIGAEARIVLDAVPEFTIPGTVSFVSPRAQFTPRQVETEDERAALMFRVRIRIEPDLLEQYRDQVKTGLPGLAYIRLDETVAWPARLEDNLIQ